MQEGPRRVLIYGLVDPRDHCLRYIGKTNQAASYRFAQHICHRVRNRTKCSSWIRSLQKLNLRPDMVALESASENTWREAEKFWIASFRLFGADLCNLAEGGNGRSGYKLSEEHKAKIAASTTGRRHSEEAKRKVSLAKIGKPRPDLAERNARSAKLSQAQVADIRKSQDKGASLARQYGVSPSMIYFIRNNMRRVISQMSKGVVS